MLSLRHKVPLAADVTGLATAAKFSPDGKRLAVVQGLSVLLVDVGSGTTADTVLTFHTKPISDVCWSPDGECIATASDDFTVEIIHLAYGSFHRLVGHTAPVVSLCFNSKGNILCSSSMDESIKIWDVLNGNIMRTIAAHSEAVVSIDMPAHDSSILSSGSYDGLIRIFDVASGHCLKTLTYDKDWKSENGVVPISQVKFSKNSKYLLVKSLDGVVKIWDCIRGYVVRTFDAAPVGGHKTLRYSCGMSFLYTDNIESSSPIVLSGDEQGKIYCWNTSNKSLQFVLSNEEYHKDGPIMSIDTHDNLVCSLSLDGACYLWEWQP